MLLVSHRPGPDRPAGGGRQMTLMHSSTGTPMPKRTRAGPLLALAVTGPPSARRSPHWQTSRQRRRPPRGGPSPVAPKLVLNGRQGHRLRTGGGGTGPLGAHGAGGATARTWYGEFRTEFDRSDRPSGQRAVVQDGSGEGALLAAEQRHQALCARMEKAGTETEAALKDYGTLPVEEGGHGDGVHTVISWGVFDTRLATSVTRRDSAGLGVIDRAPSRGRGRAMGPRSSRCS